MKWKKQKTLLLVILSAILLFADMGYTGATPPEVEWNRTFGGAGIERAEFVKQTSDDGYILTGSTRMCRGCPADVWLIKTDPKGNERWNTTFGGTGSDRVDFFKQTSDGGYIIAGKTDSYRAGDADVWLIKLEGNLIQAKEDSAKSEKQSPHTQDVPGFNASFAIGSLLSAGHFVLRKSLV